MIDTTQKTKGKTDERIDIKDLKKKRMSKPLFADKYETIEDLSEDAKQELLSQARKRRKN